MEQIIWHSILDTFFDETTMSFHIKEGRQIVRKKWTPGNRKPITDEQTMSKKEINDLIDQIYKEIEERDDGFLEIDRKMSKVLQLWPYRIVIVYPPLSDGLEMTIVKPIKKLTMDEYQLSPESFDLLRNKAKGILVSWAPGSGKTTFAQALIDVYHQDHNVIKTIESPRDLQVSDDIVQYSFTYGTHDEVRDILLLSRPDYTVYDEVRNKSDFELYKDLRLTWIWLVGVIHATRPVDSIQRFLGTIEMGIIPQVIDTVVYISKWQVAEIYTLQLTVKVPEWMQSEELARPVIIVSSFLTKKVEYEIYTFGEQIVVMPLTDETGETKVASKGKSMIGEYARQTISQKLQKILPCDFLLQVKGASVDLYIPDAFRGRIIGKGWWAISQLEKDIWLSINVKWFEDIPLWDIQTTMTGGKGGRGEIAFPAGSEGKEIILIVGDDLIHDRIDSHGIVVIKDKNTLKQIQKHGYLIANANWI